MWRAVANGARCPCLSGETYGSCCAPFHAGADHAPTAERLMRSRYSAFVVGDADYLLRTWHPSTRPGALELDPEQRWYRLEILRTGDGGPLDREGTIEFTARSRLDGMAAEQHEVSRFVRVDGRWSYLDGS
ncbi:MAG: SEC-C domain-containing protein [Burkholderiaceae bacterium]|nr:SEC-C domain-containing protein [Microbacteriaceae bacterium]